MLLARSRLTVPLILAAGVAVGCALSGCAAPLPQPFSHPAGPGDVPQLAAEVAGGIDGAEFRRQAVVQGYTIFVVRGVIGDEAVRCILWQSVDKDENDRPQHTSPVACTSGSTTLMVTDLESFAVRYDPLGVVDDPGAEGWQRIDPFIEVSFHTGSDIDHILDHDSPLNSPDEGADPEDPEGNAGDGDELLEPETDEN